MKCVIAGSRDILDYELLLLVIEMSGVKWNISQIVSGKAPGVDTLGERFAKENYIPIKDFPADWDQYGKCAGPKRNQQMAEYTDVAICLWDGESPGTRSMIKYMKNLKKPVFVYKTNGTYKWHNLENAWWLDE